MKELMQKEYVITLGYRTIQSFIFFSYISTHVNKQRFIEQKFILLVGPLPCYTRQPANSFHIMKLFLTMWKLGLKIKLVVLYYTKKVSPLFQILQNA